MFGSIELVSAFASGFMLSGALALFALEEKIFGFLFLLSSLFIASTLLW